MRATFAVDNCGSRQNQTAGRRPGSGRASGLETTFATRYFRHVARASSRHVSALLSYVEPACLGTFRGEYVETGAAR